MDSIHKQKATDYDMLKFLNEDLKHELEEREEDIKRLNEQVNNNIEFKIIFLAECFENRNNKNDSRK